MYHPDEFLERIKQTEINNLNKFSLLRLFSGFTIETTREFEGSKYAKEYLTEKKFKPDFLGKYIVLIFTVWIFSKAIKVTFFEDNMNTALLILIYILSLVLVYTVIRQFFFDKSFNYEITIDRNKIKIENQIFHWKDIYETAILTKGGGKNKREYFIIASKDMNTYEEFELRNFNGLSYWNFSATLSIYIEYFKSTSVE